MKFKTFIDVVYLIDAVLISIGLIRMEITTNENKSAIQQLNQESSQLESRIEKLQEQIFELKIEVEKIRRF